MAAVLALGVVACSTDEFVEAAPGEAAGPIFEQAVTEHFGLVVLTLTEERATPRLSARLTGSAWFVEHDAGRRAKVLDLLDPLTFGAETLSPGSTGATVTDACTLSEHRVGARTSATSGPVYFMDAGELALESDNGVLPFQSAYFPDVDPDIGGLVYDADGPRARELLASPMVRVTGSGATEVGPFVAELRPPAPLRLTRVGSSEVLQMSSLGTTLPAPTQDDLVVTWLSARPTDGRKGTVSVRYVRQGFDRVAALTCEVPDTGRYAIPAEALATLPDMGDDETDRLEVARVSVTDFEADGLGRGTAVIVARDSVLLP